MHILREEDMELFSRGQPEGESRTFNVKFTEEDLERDDGGRIRTLRRNP